MEVCAREGCQSDGMWNPKILVSPDGIHYAQGSFMRLPVCDTHREALTVDDFIGSPQVSGETGWELICRLFRVMKVEGQSVRIPQREYTKLEWEEF